VLWWLIGDEDEAELKAWSAQVEEIGNGEFTAASSSPAFGRGSCGVLGALGWELVSE